jgi:hypothetical protein
MRLFLFTGLLLVLATGLALGCGPATSTTSSTAVTVTATPTTAPLPSTEATTTTATTYTSAMGLTTTTHNRLTDPTYSNATTTEATRTTLGGASERALVEPYLPFVRAVFEELGADEDFTSGIGGFGFITGYDDKAHGVVLETPMSIGVYVKFRDLYDDRAWEITQAVAAVYTDDEYVALLKGNPLPSWRLSLDGIMYEVPATVLTGIAKNQVSKEEWLRTTGR